VIDARHLELHDIHQRQQRVPHWPGVVVVQGKPIALGAQSLQGVDQGLIHLDVFKHLKDHPSPVNGHVDRAIEEGARQIDERHMGTDDALDADLQEAVE